MRRTWNRNVSHDELPLLESRETAALAPDALPPYWRTRVTSEAMRPALMPGHSVLLERDAKPRPGDVVAVAERGRVFFRRVIDVGTKGFLLRADLAPFADGWFPSVLGRVLPSARIEVLGRLAPRLWSPALLRATRARAEGRARLTHLARKRRRRAPAGFVVREPLETDEPALERFERRLRGSHEAPLPSLREGQHLFALFTPSGAVAGRVLVTCSGASAMHEGLHVSEELRGGGGGRLLVEACQRAATEHRCEVLRCWIHVRNVGSERLHAALGFERGEYLRGSGLFDSERPHVVWSWRVPR